MCVLQSCKSLSRERIKILLNQLLYFIANSKHYYGVHNNWDLSTFHIPVP